MTTSNSQTCPECAGSPMFYFVGGNCPTCHGTGRIAKNPRSDDTEVSGPDNHTERVPANPNYTIEDMGELKRRLVAIERYVLTRPPNEAQLSGHAEYHYHLPFEMLYRLMDGYAQSLIAAHDRARLDAVLEAIEDFKTANGKSVPSPDVTGAGEEWTWIRGYLRGSKDTMHDLDTKLRPAVKAIFKMEDK